jgi:hypothetical protein
MGFDAKLEAYLAELEAAWADRKISLAEFSNAIVGVASLASELAKDLKNPGDDKKKLVLRWVGFAFDALWPKVPLPMLVAPFRGLLTPMVRGMTLAIADGVVEFTYQKWIK